MHTMSSRILVAGVLAGVCLLATGCTDNNSTVFIRHNTLVEGDCVVTPGPDTTALASGTLDPAVRPTYNAAFIVGNQLIKRGDEAQFKVETSRVVFNEAEVEVFAFDGGSLGAFSVPVSGFADPSQGGEPGYGVVFAPIIDPTTSASLAGSNQTVVSRVKLFGESLGGTDVETGYYDYPVNICSGCLTIINVDCTVTEIDCGCAPGQDSLVDGRCVGAAVTCL